MVEHIVEIHDELFRNWGNGGWAPGDAARILRASRLDWLLALAHCLQTWKEVRPTAENHDGLLILAWANLGSLVEGSMKFFLSVFLYDYRNSVRRKKADSVFKSLWDEKAQEPIDVDGLMFEKLRVFFAQEVWNQSDGDHWNKWLFHLQSRRNTIHAYKTRELGTFDEFFDDVRLYRRFLLEEMTNVPDPPDQSDWR